MAEKKNFFKGNLNKTLNVNTGTKHQIFAKSLVGLQYGVDTENYRQKDQLI